MKLAALLAGFIGIILVGCSSGAPTAVEHPTPNIDATVEAATPAEPTPNIDATVEATPPAEVAPTPNIEATVEARLEEERAVDATVEARAKELVAEQVNNLPPNPDLAEDYYNRGLGYFKSGDWQLAIGDFTKAIPTGIQKDTELSSLAPHVGYGHRGNISVRL